jgi:Protein of unknown function (DUF2806)
MDLTTILTAAAAGQLLSPATAKLLQSVGSFIGKAYEPRRIRKKGIAEREAIETKSKAKTEATRREAQAKADAQRILAIGKAESARLAERAAARIETETLRQQYNREAIVQQAAGFLPERVSDEAVHEDWVAQFFEQCQNVSDSEMQSLWGQILAGEVARPGSFSMRTLHAVKMLRKEDARLFTSVCRFRWITEEAEPVSFCFSTEADLPYWAPAARDALRHMFVALGITRLKLVHLQSLGLLSLGDPSQPLSFRRVMAEATKLSYFGQRYAVVHPNDDRPLQIPANFFTDVGRELAPIAGAEILPEYLELTIEQMKQSGFLVRPAEAPAVTAPPRRRSYTGS